MSPEDSRWRLRRILRWCFIPFCGLLIAGVLLLITVTNLDGPHSRQVANESAAVSKLRMIHELQTKYAVTHPRTGFACDLPLLNSERSLTDSDDNPLRFLDTGVRAGYKFAIANCYHDPEGVVVDYEVVAVPVARGVTGFRAFCTNDAGILWYDDAGLAANCVVSKHALE
jgi:hypothetical protein